MLESTFPQYGAGFAGTSWVGHVIPETDLVVEEMIAATNMSTVYRARSTRLGRTFCAKAVPRNLDGRRRWELEIRMLAEIRSPHVVKLFRTVDVGDYVVIVTDWAPGCTLRDWVATDGVFTPEEVIPIATQIAQGLHEVHDRGVVHRDVKPENIIIDRLPSGDVFARILDFGIAKHATAKSGSTGFIGSPLYAAPEQIEDDPVDRRTDIYSLGCVLYFALTGRPPFARNEIYALMHAHLHQDPPRPSARRSLLKNWGIDELIAKMMAKDPRDRPSSCAELIVRLDGAGRRASPPDGFSRRELTCVGQGLVVTANRRELSVRTGETASHFQLPLEHEHEAVTALHYKDHAVYWATGDGRLFRTDVIHATHESIASLPAQGPITGLSGVKNGVVAVDGSGTVYVVRAERCEVVRPATRPRNSGGTVVAGAANADTFVTADEDGEVNIFGGHGTPRRLGHVRPPFPIRGLAVSPDGYVAALTGKSSLWVVNLLDGSVLHRLERDLSDTRSLFFDKGTLFGLGASGEVVHQLA